MTKEDLKYKVMDVISVVVSDYLNSNVYLYSTQAAFFLIISVIPFAMFLLSLLKFIYPISDGELLAMINHTIPNSMEYYASYLVRQLYTQSSLSLTSVSAITTLWAASKSTHSLSQGLNQIYKTGKERTMIQQRIASLVNTIILMVTMLFCLIILVFGNQFDSVIEAMYPNSLGVLSLINFRNIISFIVLVGILDLLYTVLPIKTLRFRDQFKGALACTIIWIGFSWIYSVYVNNIGKFSITYGILASLVFAMLWLQICMNIFLMCAQLNVYLYEIQHGFEDHDY